MCPSGPVGKSSTPVYVLMPYYMEVKPGHQLSQTYSGFAGMTDQWSTGSAESEMTTKCPRTHSAMLGVLEVTTALRTRRLRWFGHVARSSSCTNSITSMTIPSTRRRGRPKKTCSECVKADMRMCSLGSIDPMNREAWECVLDTLTTCCLPQYLGHPQQ